MECVVCFEMTNVRTSCGHFVCKSCQNCLQKSECPYCRQVIRTWDYQDIRMPFYSFTELFYEHYRKNSIYYYLKIGLEDTNVLSENDCFIFHNPMGNCPFTENYEKLITLRIFNITFPRGRPKIEFQTRGIDAEGSRHYFTIQQSQNSFTSFDYWIRQNKKLCHYWDQICNNS